MIATLVVPFTFNLWFRKILNVMEITGGVLHICLFVIFVVILIVFGSRSGDDFVFETLIWGLSGWNSKGVSFGLGILPATFALTGCDSVLHMSDEVKQAKNRIPRSIIFACVLNSVFLMAFIIILLFFMGPLEAIPEAAPLPILNVLFNATGSKTATNTLALHVSYFLPILFMLIRRLGGPKPPYGPFRLGALGVPLNIFSLCFLAYVGMWMPFPQTLPVTKDNMNYAGPVFGAVIVGALLDWFLNGRKRFQMPVVRYE
ncbi:uncharacterized protein N0V89_002272 [Didymosphaeria variabile]|uniref:Uncharacterized protein n=1 Tax=Didymosphaeria variabile TaxID=1932322 RepID=A0A9W9CDF8_9PLEO|nr:uncharacterized protein N0V89_002272 [Didymosphaeria variabile]KAJ4357696.1 hypothetical protein N0V89_002272 [Didymosphaeria variabile]